MTKKHSSSNPDKDMAKIFLELYMDCMKYKDKNPQKNITCDQFSDTYKHFIHKYSSSTSH